MQNRRIRNIEIFEDSVELMNENAALQRAIEASIMNQRLYLETEAAVLSVPHKKKKNVETVISQKRSFEAASQYARAGKKSTKKKKDITFFVVIQREDEEEENTTF